MANFIHASAPWVNPAGGQSYLRSLTPSPMNKHITKSISTPHLGRADSDDMNTIPDPRAATPQPAMARNDSTDSSMHPDLSQEVATLSTKLINAINNQTSLDDSLQQTRHELDTANEKLAHLEYQVRQHQRLVATGLLVDKVVYSKMEQQLMKELKEERSKRLEAEREKRKVDGEIETLTAALFEEANVMVSAARRETEASEKRNEQLKQQLGDAEILQLSLQEQLQDLKGVMERMNSDRDESESSNTLATTTAPSTPGIAPSDKMSKLLEATMTPNTPGSDDITPEHPLHFSHLIHPVLRSDLLSFREFQDMLKVSRSSAPPSRASSGNYSSFNVLGLGSLTNNSTSSLPNAGNYSPRDSTSGLGMPNLKDEKFYKRTLVEDIEPTLRLDIAPGLSWIARRTVINSITVGSLVVEPHPPVPKFRGPVFPCSLCGENRIGDQYTRKFRFKTSESEDSQKYPLCDWCLGRVRATCDFIGFLRMVAAGHWRAETEEEKKAAWEESVRLRERMFWTRLGGGVVPAFVSMRESPRSPTFAHGIGKGEPRKSEESQLSDKPLDSAVDMQEIATSDEDPFQNKDDSQVKRISIGRTVISNHIGPVETPTSDEEKKLEDEAEAQLLEEVRNIEERAAAQLQSAVQKPQSPAPINTKMEAVKQQHHQRSISSPISPLTAPRKKDERLSLQIPGAFE
ncbi:Sec2p-domain-containing protein [Pleomassaria siparia CBS 279.74]|uniref:Sec2p-domain-containing protein n=1 Tax=Pleomassaria siparia CBS 279.74 TaxID=1314801 RepID=A0A6G1KAN6_9PLEO|nr:Sec2p-domain-containing protein [Pleomassaria siparia CBS 279.74]